jgi:hypothetical protein
VLIDLSEERKWELTKYLYDKTTNDKYLENNERVFGPTIQELNIDKKRLKIPKSMWDVEDSILKKYSFEKDSEKLLDLFRSAYWDKLGYRKLPSYVAVRVFNNSVFFGAALSHKLLHICISSFTEFLPWSVEDIFNRKTVEVVKDICNSYSVEHFIFLLKEEVKEELKHLIQFYPEFEQYKKPWNMRNLRF